MLKNFYNFFKNQISRKIKDGGRVVKAIKRAEGKKLAYYAHFSQTD